MQVSDGDGELAAYHEAGHVVANTAIGRPLKSVEIWRSSQGQWSGLTDTFPDYQEYQNSLEKLRYPDASFWGIVEDGSALPPSSISLEVREEVYRTHFLQLPYLPTLMTYAAGIEAEIKRAKEQGWGTRLIRTAAQRDDDRQKSLNLIELHGESSNANTRLRNASRRAKTLLDKAQAWSTVQIVAQKLMRSYNLSWQELPSNIEIQEALESLRVLPKGIPV